MKLPHCVVSVCELGRDVFSEYSDDHGSLMAAAISFYVFLSLIPLLLLAVASCGYLLGSPERAQAVIFGYLRQALPAISNVESCGIGGIIDQVLIGRGAATGFGIVLLLWSSTTLMANLELAINVAWDVDKKRNLVARRFVALLALALGGLLFGVSVAATAVFHRLQAGGMDMFGVRVANWPWLWRAVAYFVPLIATICAFTILYKVLPNTRVRLRAAILGGVFAGVLWELAKICFGIYVTRFSSYSAIYGSLGGIILLLIWINYSAVVAILGAEVASIWQKRHYGTRP